VSSPKKPVSPARHIVGLVVLLAVCAVGWIEYSAVSGFNAAVNALNTRAQDEEHGLLSVQETESLLGKTPDGPGTDVQEGSRTFTKKTYTWRGLIRSHPLTAFYTKDAEGHLHHFETAGAPKAAK
jgi:hypothetical protein